jgi:ABC-2 type transport system permease protein
MIPAPPLIQVLGPKLRWRPAPGAARSVARWAFGLVGVLIALGIYGAAVWFLRLCYDVEVIGPLLCRRLLDVVLLVLLSVLVLSNLITALSSFFLADDLELLVAAPVAPRTLFSARLAEQIVQSSWMVLVFGAPVLLAFARVCGDGRTYLVLAAALPPLLVIPAAAGAAVALLLVFSLPAARVRAIVAGMAFVAFLVLYLLARLLEPERFMNPEGFASMVSFLASFSAPSSAFLPSSWATTAMAATFRDSVAQGGAALALVLLWSGAGAAHALSSALFRMLYPRAYSRSTQSRTVAHFSRLWAWLRREPLPTEGPIRAPRRRGARSDFLRAVGWLAPRGLRREFLIKDLKLLLRDPSQWSQLVLLFALAFVYIYNFRHFRSISEAGLIGRMAIGLIGMALCGFVTAAVSVRFAFPMISIEGRMRWLLRAAPVRPAAILRAKALGTLPPLLVFAEVMAIASARVLGASPAMTALGAVVAGLTAVSVGVLSAGLGALMPDYRAESAAKVAASFGGLICMSLSLLVALALVACAVYPAQALFRNLPLRPWPTALSAGVALLVTTACVIGPLALGGRALDRDDR